VSDRRAWARILIFAAGYVLVGMVTGYLATRAPSIPARNLWRLSAWVLGLVLFLMQASRERLRFAHTTIRSAWHTAAAVALAAFLLAVVGPLRAHWGSRLQGLALLSLVLWPALTGIAAFLAGALFGALVGRVRRRT